MRKQIRVDQQYQQEVKKTKYTKTSIKKRQQLINLVINKFYSIYMACKKLRMSYTSGRIIILNFQNYGADFNCNNSAEHERTVNKAEDKNISNTKDVKEEQIDEENRPKFIQDKERWQILQKMGVAPFYFPFAQYQPPFSANFQE